MKEKINISGIEDDLVISANENKNIFSNKLLNQKKIAISISINEDIDKLGFSLQHLNDISVEIARYIVANGGTALYGGDLRLGGFTDLFSELSNQYKISNDRTFRFENYFPFPNSKLINTSIKVEFKAKQINPIILPIPENLGEIDIKKDYKPFDNIQDRYIYCECFKDMRIKMAQDCSARIIIGGKISGYLGYMPGIIEEALYTLLNDKPLYLIGGFGGATLKLINLLMGADTKEISNEYQYNTAFLKEFKEYINDKYPFSDYEVIKEKLSNFNIETISSKNKLSVEENEILFTSKNIHEILYLIMKGLTKIN